MTYKGIYSLLSLPLFMVSACGGGGSSSHPPDQDNPTTFRISSIVPEGGRITPDTADIAVNGSAQFMITAEEGFNLEEVEGCEGTLEGMQYSVQSVTANCSITVNFSRNIYAVDTMISVGGRIDRPNDKVAHGDSVDFRLMPHTDYRVETVTGCDGQLSNLLYSTGVVNESCTVDVLFTSWLPEPIPPLTLVRIPVVFHILDRGEMLSDVRDEEIISQIEATNRHFRQFNVEELESLPDEYKPYVADIGIQFYLADRNPQGEPHSGIIRVKTETSVFSDGYDFAHPELGGSAPWPNDRYINVWVGDAKDFFDPDQLAFFGRAHVPTIDPDQYIGINVEESLIGTIDPQVPDLGQGKTFTHELAHFLGLIGHTHGTPTDSNNHAHLTCDGNNDTACKNADLTNNFMNVEQPDSGMKMFSISQRQVMREWLETGPLTALYQNSLVQL